MTITTKPNLQKRFFAGLIDYGIIFIVAFFDFYFFGEKAEDGLWKLNGLPPFGLMIFWFAWTVVAEQFSESTFGNQLMNLKVLSINENDTEPSFGQSFKRHLLDLFDLWPVGILGILFIKNTKYNQRLGDFWAKTIVVDILDKEQGIIK